MAGSQHGWTVTGQVTDQAINNNSGQTVVGTYVYFVTNQGQEGSVFIPDGQYNQKNVTEAIRVKAKALDEVFNLSENYSPGG